jgi:hypothetical protein
MIPTYEDNPNINGSILLIVIAERILTHHPLSQRGIIKTVTFDSQDGALDAMI